GLPAAASVLDDRLPARWGRHAARYAAIGLLAAASVSGGWYLLARGRRAPQVARPEPSIAVLPFADLSPHGDQAYFSDGVAAEIVSALVQIEGLRVAGRVSSFSLRKVEDLRQVGEKLKVAHVLEGSVQREGNKIRITASMIGVADGQHVWSKTFNREIGSILVLQDDIARE